MGARPRARPFQGLVQPPAHGIVFFGRHADRNPGPFRPAYADSREWLGHLEPVPRVDKPGPLRLQMKCPDGSAGHLAELNGSHLGLVARPPGSVRSEDCGASRLDDAFQAKQPFARAAGTRPPDGAKAEHSEHARDHLPVETLTDQDDGPGPTVVVGARQNALVPEAVDLGSSVLAAQNRHNAFFGNYLKTPGAPDDREQDPDQARNNRQPKALGKGEPLVSGCVHFLAFSCNGASASAPAGWRACR